MAKEKKNERKNEHEIQEEKPSKHKEKELYWIILGMIGIIVIVIGVYYYSQSLKKFEFEGLEFSKEYFGKIPLFRYSYYFTDDVGRNRSVNLNLRIDPRKNNVSIDGEIIYPKDKFVYVSINSTNLTSCDFSAPSVSSLAQFLSSNNIEVKSAFPDEKEANSTGIRHANCNTHPTNLVILIQSGKETKITKPTPNCHIIDVSNCEILDAIEKFELQSIIDAKNAESV
ncbi:MAG: hypothetical protein AABY10_05080 [Nanoarchaeota archaeon]